MTVGSSSRPRRGIAAPRARPWTGSVRLGRIAGSVGGSEAARRSDDEVVAAAELINNLVDLGYFTEEQEQEIFEFAVCRLVDDLVTVLPNEMINLVHSDAILPKDEASALVLFAAWRGASRRRRGDRGRRRGGANGSALGQRTRRGGVAGANDLRSDR